MNYLKSQKMKRHLRASKSPKEKKQYKKIVIKRPQKNIDIQKYKKSQQQPEKFMKFFNQGLSGNIRQRAAHTKLKYTAMQNNQKRGKGRVKKGMTFQNKY